MDSGNPPGVCQSPSRVHPEYVEECKVLSSGMRQHGGVVGGGGGGGKEEVKWQCLSQNCHIWDTSGSFVGYILLISPV
jgi:hypothetical protein